VTTDDDADWVSQLADRAIAEADRRGGQRPIVGASGISPSGPIHLGNLREIMVPHLVADEIRRRGLPCRHVFSWDDYDRLRKVPAGLPDDFATHIGRPLADVPDPCGEHESWAEHFKVPFRDALAQLAVDVDEVSQAAQYRSGAYRAEILRAMAHRREIYDILAKFRLKAPDAESDDEADDGIDEPGEPDDGLDEPGGSARDEYSPYRPYCRVCGRDTTHVTAYDDETTTLSYHCDCGHDDAFRLDSVDHGKLAWKVDWPMRWAFENVDFEAGGADHSSPGSSFTVGQEIVRSVFGGDPPTYVQYSFVGTDGASKMSGSTGNAPTPLDALEIIEPSILRWLYCREPRRSFTIAFNEKIANLYDGWDHLDAKIADGTVNSRERAMHARAGATASTTLPATARVLPFRSLASVVDITNGDPGQVRRIAGSMLGDPPLISLDEIRPRLDCAAAWVTTYLPASERTHVRATPDSVRLGALDDAERQAIAWLLDGLDDDWSLDGLTTLLYGIPKRQHGLAVDAKTLPPEVKAAQRAFFVLLYELLTGRDTGPRLPTLLLSLGADRVCGLLAP
jgi:lysyl-tRNA synthetase class 1